MLLSRRRNLQPVNYDSVSFHNYYERLVREAVIEQEPQAATDFDLLADVSCVALNHLPPRYIRHDVDMSFYMSPIELDEVMNKVNQAVKHAIEFVSNRERASKHEPKTD